MRFLLVNADYPGFLRECYAQDPPLRRAPFDQQMAARNRTLFGVADFYSRHLRDLGHEAWDIHINNTHLQRAWAREHGLRVGGFWPWDFLPRRRFLPWAAPWFLPVLEAQVRHYRPDVLLNHCAFDLPPPVLRRLRPHVGWIVGQHAATALPADWDWGVYDLMLSSFPPTLRWFAERGVKARLYRLGFEPAILERLQPGPAKYDVSFVGSLQAVHQSRTDWLEAVCRAVRVEVWTSDADRLPAGSAIRRGLRGQAWGLAMYQVLRDSRITLNHHGSVPPFANNMRLYEATGAGTLLVTDWKENLVEMFEPGREVLAYRDADEAVAMIQAHLADEERRRTIAAAGQARTLRSHTYRARMEELVAIVAEELR